MFCVFCRYYLQKKRTYQPIYALLNIKCSALSFDDYLPKSEFITDAEGNTVIETGCVETETAAIIGVSP